MDAETPQGSKSFKFTTTDYEVEALLDQYQQELKIRLIQIKNRNIYQAVIDQNSLPQQLKTFLSNIKTVYEYIEVNKDNSDKIVFGETGKIHIYLMLAFGPTSQIRKEIVIDTELKQVGSVEGSNMKEHFDKLREQIIEINKKYDDEKKKMKSIINTIEKSNQRLIVEAEALKLENIDMKKKQDTMEERVNAMEILLKELYTRFEGLKEEKQELQKKVQESKSLIIQSPMNSMGKKTNSRQLEQVNEKEQLEDQASIIRKIKTLQMERDQEKKMLEDSLAEKELKLNQKVQSLKNLQRQSNNNSQQSSNQLKDSKNRLKDSDFQRVRNAVSAQNSRQTVENLRYVCSDSTFSSSSSGLGKARKIGLTGKYYCGENICQQNCAKCKGKCGPSTGDNCAECMKLDLQRRGLKRGFLINSLGQVAWMENGHFCCGAQLPEGNISCGVNSSYCKSCNNLTQNFIHRYKALF